jgi:peroxiredoxin
MTSRTQARKRDPACHLAAISRIEFCGHVIATLESTMSLLRQLSRWFGAHPEMTTISAGNSAPNFSLRSLDGKNFSLAESLKKGPVVVAFFKVSCPVCQFTLPFIDRLFRRYQAPDVTFLAVSQDNVKSSRGFAQEFGVTFPIVLDEANYPVSNAYGLTMVPTVLLVEPDGTAKVSSMGFVKADLEAIADSLADRRNLTRTPVFLKTESVPASKPG